jgi:adenylate cyclase
VSSARRQAAWGLAAGLAAGVLGAVLWFTGTLERAENLSWDWRVRRAATASPAADRIKLILLDQPSLDWGREVNGLSWPWPRELYAAVLSFCRRGGARSIALDVLFTEPSVYGVWDDEVLGEALAARPDAVAVCFVESDGEVTWPIPEVRRGAAWLGDASGRPDADGVIRRAQPAVAAGDTTIASLGLAIHRLERSDAPTATGPEILAFAPAGSYERFSAAAIVQSELRLLEGGEPVIDPEALRDCHVLFGFSAPGLLDQRATPLSRVSPGVLVHATLLDNLLAGGFVRPAPAWAALLTTLLLGLAAGLAAARASRAWQTAALFLLGLPLPLAAGLLLYGQQLWWPVTPGTVAVLGGLVGGLGVNWSTEGRQRRFLRQAFRHYLSPAVVDRLVQEPGRLQLGGERRELTIMFSDLADFTSLGEQLEPEDLTALLNAYLSAMTDVVLAEGGTLDKYEGDAIVAFWNAPLDQPDHAARACRAAVRCQRELARKQELWRLHAGRDLAMRVGLHTGPVVVGNMGSRQRFDYTILGDAANLASRLEGANKLFGTGILASEQTVRAAGGAVLARELGRVVVKGRREPVDVHELGGLAGDDEPPSWAPYREALELCRAGQLPAAQRLLAGLEDDPAARALAACMAAEPSFRGLFIPAP